METRSTRPHNFPVAIVCLASLFPPWPIVRVIHTRECILPRPTREWLDLRIVAMDGLIIVWEITPINLLTLVRWKIVKKSYRLDEDFLSDEFLRLG